MPQVEGARPQRRVLLVLGVGPRLVRVRVGVTVGVGVGVRIAG